MKVYDMMKTVAASLPKKNLYILLAVCLYGMALCAEPITKQQAQQLAAGWLRSKNPAHRAPAAPGMMRTPAKMKTDVVLQAVNTTGNPYIYAVNDADGYVLVSGDDRAPAILGYVEKGCYDESQLPENMRSWLQHYIDEIKLLQQYNLTSPQKTIPTVGEPIAKTTTCQWDQLAPYNYDCPMVTTYSDAACTIKRREPMHAVTGCPATALAQVLYVWKDEYAKPEVKEGKLKCAIPARVDVVAEAYEVENKKKVPVWLKYTDEGIPASTTIDWANLTDLYSKRDSVGKAIADVVMGTPEQQDAVARLMHICGSLCNMQYGTKFTGGSGSDELSVLSGAVKYLNFDHARLHQRFMYEYDEWIKVLYDELKVAKAVFFGGNSTEGGHAFVIDGYYKEDLFHVNWGWSGVADEAMENGGYYRINSLLPINQGTGGAVVNDGFRLMQAFISGIYPNAQKPAEEPNISVSVINTYLMHADVRDGKLKFPICLSVGNHSVLSLDAQVGLCLEDEGGNRNFVPLSDGLKTYPLAEATNIDSIFTLTGVTDGDYKLRMFSRSTLDDDAWKPCVGADRTYIRIHVSGGKATFSNGGSREAELISCDMKKQFAKGEDATFTLRYKVTKGSYENAVFFLVGAPVVVDDNGDFSLDGARKECIAMPPAVVTAKEGEEFTITGVLAADGLEVGRYTLLFGSPAEFLITGHDFEVVDGGTDDIDAAAIHETTQDSNVWYDLQGRRYEGKPSVPGLYVNNGKKVLLK